MAKNEEVAVENPEVGSEVKPGEPAVVVTEGDEKVAAEPGSLEADEDEDAGSGDGSEVASAAAGAGEGGDLAGDGETGDGSEGLADGAEVPKELTAQIEDQAKAAEAPVQLTAAQIKAQAKAAAKEAKKAEEAKAAAPADPGAQKAEAPVVPAAPAADGPSEVIVECGGRKEFRLKALCFNTGCIYTHFKDAGVLKIKITGARAAEVALAYERGLSID